MAKKILLVDDERNLNDIVAMRLKCNNYEVITAYDGQDGLDKARKENPDLIIMDLMLPKMDGYKVCGLLKKDSRYSRIPIIMFTARAQEEDMDMAKEVGADDYIVKPFDAEALLTKVKELLKE